MQRLLEASSTKGKGNATYPMPKACYLCIAAADELLDKYGVNELTGHTGPSEFCATSI